jgi:hypothetical protein
LKVFALALKEVDNFCFCSWRLKVFVLALKAVDDFCFCSRRLEVFALAFKCWRFLLFLLNVESFYSYFWMLKVLIFTFWC